MINPFCKKIEFKPESDDKIYQQVIDEAKELGIFKGCGNLDNKWVILQFRCQKQFDLWYRGEL